MHRSSKLRLYMSEGDRRPLYTKLLVDEQMQSQSIRIQNLCRWGIMRLTPFNPFFLVLHAMQKMAKHGR